MVRAGRGSTNILFLRYYPVTIEIFTSGVYIYTPFIFTDFFLWAAVAVETQAMLETRELTDHPLAATLIYRRGCSCTKFEDCIKALPLVNHEYIL